ncbi:MAG TPA: DNA polymerase III subunit beta [Candidatus Rifleibacterium sp.]|nr:DNA polymerase III subunit beta [Candidatus Rifleibacterium sp.]HPT44294.1 DNA polymerase III subunit beta [Candidatus Rifleibacterium sp.]
MRFQLPLKTLTETVAMVSKAVAAKGIKPILANLLITAQNNQLRFVGTDLEVMMISTIEAEIEENGSFTIPAKLIQEIITSIPADENTVTRFELTDADANEITIISGRSKYTLQIQSIEDFPPVPVVEEEGLPVFQAPGNAMARALKEAGVAMSVEDGNPVQKSICIDFSNQDRPVMASTDSKRLAVTRIQSIQVPEIFRRAFIVPSRAVAELQKLFESNEQITIGLYKEQLVFSSPQFQLITRLVEGRFPDYNRVLPKESSRILKLKRKELTQSLKAVVPIARNISGLVHFDVSANETKIWSDAKEQGKAESFLQSELNGEPINIAFNVKFLQDFLNVLDDEEVVIEMTTPSYPGMMRPGNPESEFKYVVMPMSY